MNILLDSSFLIAYYNPLDEHRKKAIKIMDDLIIGKYGNPYVSDYIFDEVVTVIFIRTKDLKLSNNVGDVLRDSLGLFDVDEEVFDNAWKIFKNQKNTNFSFTDCTILAVMQERGISRIATFDEDFLKFEGIKVVS